jgi:hypothetical protein
MVYEPMTYTPVHGDLHETDGKGQLTGEVVGAAATNGIEVDKQLEGEGGLPGLVP